MLQLILFHTSSQSWNWQSQEEVPVHSLSVKSEDDQTRDDQTSSHCSFHHDIPTSVLWAGRISRENTTRRWRQRQAERHQRQKRWNGRREKERQADEGNSLVYLVQIGDKFLFWFHLLFYKSKPYFINQRSSQPLWLNWQQTTCRVCLDKTLRCFVQVYWSPWTDICIWTQNL